MTKITKEKFKVYGNVFDNFTLRTLFKLSSEGHFDELASPIKIGKESNVFSAKRGDDFVIVKIYRLQSCDFNRMYDYIKYDPRFVGLRKNKRKVVFAWCQREYRNLLKAREAGVSVPLPIAFQNNVLVLEFIGDEEVAPQLKNAEPKNKERFFHDVVENIKKLYKAGLIHGDLSEFNILNYNEKPVFIDFSQCTTTNSIRAEELIERDINNICRYFKKIGLKFDEKEIEKKIKK